MADTKRATKNFLRPHEVEAAQTERQRHVDICNRPDPDGRLQKANSQKAIQNLNKRLEQAPPDLSPDQRDKVAKRVAECEAKLQEGMLSHEEMRRNPPGATSQNIRWNKINKHNIQDWKNGLLALNKGIPAAEAEDMLNIDRLRPDSSRLNMDGAQIPKTRAFFQMSEAYKSTQPGASTWEDVFGSGDPEKDAMAAKLKEREAYIAKIEAEKAALEAANAKTIAEQAEVVRKLDQAKAPQNNQQRR